MNYKRTLALGACLTLIVTFFSFSPNPYEDVLLFVGDAKRITHYRYQNNMGEEEHYTGKKKIIDGKEYNEKKISSVTGKERLEYYRKGQYNFYKYNEKANREEIIVPIAPKIGEIWTSADRSLKYEVVALNLRFRTPAKKYKSAIWIMCIPQKNPYGIQRTKHYMHYVKGEGLVAITDTKGNFTKYLTDIDD